MILLDTHVWVWWVQNDPRLGAGSVAWLDGLSDEGIGVHVISCWEVAMLTINGRLDLPCSLDEWVALALDYPGVRLHTLTLEVAVDSCRLPGDCHKDPADRILIAAARGIGM